MNPCRICHEPGPRLIGQYKPYHEFQAFDVFDCKRCQCRFVWRKDAVHESMHAANHSPYVLQKDLAKKIARFYQAAEVDQARKYLSKTLKYRFIIDQIVLDPKTKMLEFGCSLGYLTSYFLMQNMDIVGVDISRTAISQATRLFGPHFQLMDDNFFDQNNNQFDYVFHTGTIGCVEDPIQFTKQTLNLLKPGGKLLFNAPDKIASMEMESIWVKGTPPPDLITLFDHDFWNRFFQDDALVSVTYEPYPHLSNAKKTWIRLLKRRYLSLEPKQMYAANPNTPSLLKAQLPLLLPLYLLSKLNLIHQYRADYGMFVILTKK